MAKKEIKKSTIIIIAMVLSVILYIAGVLTGINANELVEEKVKVDIDKVKVDFEIMKEFIDDSSLDIKNIQLQQFFVENFEADDQCKFQNIYMDQMYSRIGEFWDLLPSRLEDYEKTTEVTNEYIALKREYIRFSLRFWLTAKNYYKDCNDHELIPILYFYTSDCKDCVRQGNNFDMFNEEMGKQNRTVMVFPVDGNFEDDTVYLLKQFYNITSYPTIIVGNSAIVKSVISTDSLVLLSN